MEWISLGLRTRAGLDLNQVGDKLNLEKILPKLIENEWVSITGNHLVPTTKGFLVADRLPLLFKKIGVKESGLGFKGFRVRDFSSKPGPLDS